MKQIIFILIMIVLLPLYISCAQQNQKSNQSKGQEMSPKIQKSDKEWKEILSPEQYHVLREKGTERPFTGEYWNTKDKGVYKCAACGAELFSSDTKFESDCGWPSFYDVMNNKNIITRDDFSLGMHRVEVMCANCGGHLGHIFEDGPKPTGQRYCINSLSIKLIKKEK